MLIDRERSFNPLQADRVRQFDVAHSGINGPVRHETGWLIFEDGSSRDAHGDRLDPADLLEPKERRRWQIYWCQKTITLLAERFRQQRQVALQSLSEEDEAKVQATHDRLVQIKKNLDALEQEQASGTRPVERPVTHGVRGGALSDRYADGKEHLRKLSAAFGERVLQLEHAKSVLKAAQGDQIEPARLAFEDAERRKDESIDALRAHRRWLRMPLAKRQKINEALLAEKRERDRAEYEPYRQRKERLGKLSLGFVEDDESLQSPSQQRAAQERQHDDAVRAEGAAFLTPRMAEREERLARARNQDIEQAARDEFAEAVTEAEELAPKRRGRPPGKKAKR